MLKKKNGFERGFLSYQGIKAKCLGLISGFSWYVRGVMHCFGKGLKSEDENQEIIQEEVDVLNIK